MSVDSVQSVASTGNDHVVPREREMPSRRVEVDLRRRMEADAEPASGQALPSIASLAAQYGVSRATVAKALRRMADDGLVEVVPQWGTSRA